MTSSFSICEPERCIGCMPLVFNWHYLDKVFLTHLHMDHAGDLPAFYIYGPQNNRSVPLRVWGPEEETLVQSGARKQHGPHAAIVGMDDGNTEGLDRQ
ncbi:MAG: MBL fold metallo-hydrolase [Pirellulales bacterium]